MYVLKTCAYNCLQLHTTAHGNDDQMHNHTDLATTDHSINHR